VFTDQGSEYFGMGRQLYDSQPTFRKAVDRCDEILHTYLQQSLLSVVYPASSTSASGNLPFPAPLPTESIDAGRSTPCPLLAQPALFGLEYALVELWRSWGIVPGVVMGQGAGELATACVAGLFSLEDALKLMVERGRFFQSISNDTHDAMIGMPSNEAQKLKARQPLLAEFEKAIRRVEFKSLQMPIASSATGQTLRKEELSDVGYWLRQMQEPVTPSLAIEALRKKGYELFVEIGPCPMLPNMEQRSLSEDAVVFLPSLKKDCGEWQTMLEVLAALYVRGAEINWSGFGHDYQRQRVMLPTYPFQREIYWKMGLRPTSPEDTEPTGLPKNSERETSPLVYARPSLSSAYLAPRNELEEKFVEIWQELIGIDKVGIRDNFFELGGGSLLGVSMFAQLEKVLGRRLPPALLFEAPTVELLANFIGQGEASVTWSALVPIQPSGSKRPLFCVHPGAGTVLGFADLARHLGPDQPFYGLQARGIDGKQKPYSRVERIAEHYIKEIRTIQPDGPYLLAGRCFGGMVAFEMAQQLQAQGEHVALLAIIDTLVLHNVDADETDGDEFAELNESRPEKNDEQRAMKLNKRQKLKAELLDLYGPILLEVSRRHEKARKKYVPQPYPGKITLFRNGEEIPIPRHQLKWAELAGAGLECHALPGDHYTILLEPYVKEVAGRLRACLEAA